MHWTLDDLHGKYSSSRNANGESIVANNQWESERYRSLNQMIFYGKTPQQDQNKNCK
jgi:hypothetical protein